MLCSNDSRTGRHPGVSNKDDGIVAAARALAVGDALSALKRVALRDDPPALALRGIAMAQLGDLERAKGLLRRAGRAFVDLEGLVIHVMFEPLRWRRQAWRELVNASRARTLESGLIQIASEILNRLARSGTLSRDDAFEYLANNRDAWNIHVDEEDDEPFELLLEKLDHAILGLVEALDADDADLPRLIDESLNGSLWARQLRSEPTGSGP